MASPEFSHPSCLAYAGTVSTPTRWARSTTVIRRSVRLDSHHRQPFFRSRVGQRQEHQEIGQGALGRSVALLDPEPMLFVTNRNKLVLGFLGSAKDRERGLFVILLLLVAVGVDLVYATP